MDRKLFERVTVPKAPNMAKPTLTPQEVLKLITVVRQGQRHALRDEALLMFMFETGARANEVCTLRYDAIEWEQRIARLYGKGNKERYVPFSAITAKAMRKYAIKGRSIDCHTFFQTDEHLELTTSGLRQIFLRLSRRSGIHIAPHKCRHTFAIEYLRKGGNVFALQKTLGHASLDMTLKYAALVTDDLVKALDERSLIVGIMDKRRKRD